MWLKYYNGPLSLDKVEAPPEQEIYKSSYTKPRGFWITDDTENCWRSWCVSQKFSLGMLTHKHEVTLDEGNILILRQLYDLDDFSEQWGIAKWWGPDGEPRKYRDWVIDWDKVVARYDGLIITPYIWERRMEHNWYYGWDCASGCIWKPSAIKTIRLIEIDTEVERQKREEAA